MEKIGKTSKYTSRHIETELREREKISKMKHLECEQRDSKTYVENKKNTKFISLFTLSTSDSLVVCKVLYVNHVICPWTHCFVINKFKE